MQCDFAVFPGSQLPGYLFIRAATLTVMVLESLVITVQLENGNGCGYDDGSDGR